jgi:predicted nuclease with TOPRIM domain
MSHTMTTHSETRIAELEARIAELEKENAKLKEENEKYCAFVSDLDEDLQDTYNGYWKCNAGYWKSEDEDTEVLYTEANAPYSK